MYQLTDQLETNENWTEDHQVSNNSLMQAKQLSRIGPGEIVSREWEAASGSPILSNG